MPSLISLPTSQAICFPKGGISAAEASPDLTAVAVGIYFLLVGAFSVCQLSHFGHVLLHMVWWVHVCVVPFRNTG